MKRAYEGGVNFFDNGAWIPILPSLPAAPCIVYRSVVDLYSFRSPPLLLNYLAEAYANGDAELLMGKAVRRGIQEGVWERSDLYVLVARSRVVCKHAAICTQW